MAAAAVGRVVIVGSAAVVGAAAATFSSAGELLQNAVRVISGGGSGAGIDQKVDTLAQEMRSFMGRSQGGGLHPPGPTRNCATRAASSRCPRAQLSLRH